jgi:hypothetical protein
MSVMQSYLSLFVKLPAYNRCESNSYERSSALHCHIVRFTAGEEKLDGGGGLVRDAQSDDAKGISISGRTWPQRQ